MMTVFMFTPSYNKISVVAVLLGSVFAADAFAAESAQGLEQVVQETILNNPEVRARYHDFRSTMEGQKVARGAYLPQVDAQGWVGREYRSNTPGVGSYDWNRPGYNLELRQLIFDGFKTPNSVKQLGFEKLASYYELLATTDNVAAETARAYLDVQRQRELEKLAGDNYRLHENTLRQIRERADSGVGRRVDLEQAVGRLALAQSNWMTETSNLLDVEQRYRRIVGSEAPKALPVAPSMASQLPAGTQNFSEAMRRNPSFRAKQALIQAARAGMDVARGNFSPTLELRASTGRDRQDYDMDHRTQSSSVQLVMSYNLYRGGADSARLRQTTEQMYAARDVRDYTCRNVQQELSIAWNNVARLHEQIPFLRAHQQATMKVRDGYRQQFQIGQRSLMDLLDTEGELFDANRALASAEYDMVNAQYRWLALSHRILPALRLAQPSESERPEEERGLEGDDELMALCDTKVSDTRLLQPVDVKYREGTLPPTLVPRKDERAGSVNGKPVALK